MSSATRNCRWVKRGTVLLLLLTAACALASRRPKLPGSLGQVAARVEVGMSQDEVVALLQTYHGWRDTHDLTYMYLNGETRDGHKFGRWGMDALDALPPSGLVASAEVVLNDDRGRQLTITLGPGGVVTGLQLESSSIWEELRYSLSRGTGWSGRPRVTDRHQCFEAGLRDL